MTIKRNTSTSIAAGVKGPVEVPRPRRAGFDEKKPKESKTPEPKILTPKVDYNGSEPKAYNFKSKHFELGDKVIHKK